MSKTRPQYAFRGRASSPRRPPRSRRRGGGRRSRVATIRETS
jgi:hypothetical protein